MTNLLTSDGVHAGSPEARNLIQCNDSICAHVEWQKDTKALGMMIVVDNHNMFEIMGN